MEQRGDEVREERWRWFGRMLEMELLGKRKERPQRLVDVVKEDKVMIGVKVEVGDDGDGCR